jgi:ribosomal-protein-alanine N-acetyltransferase
MVYELHKDRLQLLNIAVSPYWRFQGVGRAMVDKLMSKLRPGRREQVHVLVDDGNLGAHLFFKATGFRATEIVQCVCDQTFQKAEAYLFVKCLSVNALATTRQQW